VPATTRTVIPTRNAMMIFRSLIWLGLSLPIFLFLFAMKIGMKIAIQIGMNFTQESSLASLLLSISVESKNLQTNIPPKSKANVIILSSRGFFVVFFSSALSCACSIFSSRSIFSSDFLFCERA